MTEAGIDGMDSHLTELAIGVDVGATKIAAALVTAGGEILATGQRRTRPQRGAAAVLDDVAALVNGWLAEHGAAVRGVGIGTPGQVNSDAGVVRNAVNLGWEEVALVDEVKARLPGDLPIWVQKDANASALGEYVYGAAQGVGDFVYIGIGSGLGGGIVAGGRLITGAAWNAAELGHLSLDPGGWLCACGNRGCAETIVSGRGLLAVTREYLEQADHDSSLAQDGECELTTKAILQHATAGDRLAMAALSHVGRTLGIVMAACVAILNPALIVLGGGLGLAAFDFLVPPARAELAHRTLAASAGHAAILRSQVASSAVGAASLVWYFGKARRAEQNVRR
jgi:glucokinase